MKRSAAKFQASTKILDPNQKTPSVRYGHSHDVVTFYKVITAETAEEQARHTEERMERCHSKVNRWMRVSLAFKEPMRGEVKAFKERISYRHQLQPVVSKIND